MYVRLTYLNFLPGKADEAKKIYNSELAPIVKQQKGNLDCRLLEPVDRADDYISMTFGTAKKTQMLTMPAEFTSSLWTEFATVFPRNLF
jgi:hypothetical protein